MKHLKAFVIWRLGEEVSSQVVLDSFLLLVNLIW